MPFQVRELVILDHSVRIDISALISNPSRNILQNNHAYSTGIFQNLKLGSTNFSA